MANPLTLLRKLGAGLVGSDGLLNDYASNALGYTKMDQAKVKLSAMDAANKQIEAESEKAARDAAIEKANYDLGRSKIEDTRADEEYNALPEELGMDKGTPPARAKARLTGQKMRQELGQFMFTQADADRYAPLGIALPPVGTWVDSSQRKYLDKLESDKLGDQNRKDAQDFQRSLRQESDAKDAAHRNEMEDFRNQAGEDRLSNEVHSNVAVNTYEKALQGGNIINQMVPDNAKGVISGQAALAVVNAFQHIVDTGAVTRDEDIRRITSGTPVSQWVDRAKYLIKTGQVIPPEQIVEIKRLANEAMKSNRANAIQAVAPYVNRARERGYRLENILPTPVLVAFDAGAGRARARMGATGSPAPASGGMPAVSAYDALKARQQGRR